MVHLQIRVFEERTRFWQEPFKGAYTRAGLCYLRLTIVIEYISVTFVIDYLFD